MGNHICKGFPRLINGYGSFNLPAGIDAIKKHVNSCGNCRAVIERWRDNPEEALGYIRKNAEELFSSTNWLAANTVREHDEKLSLHDKLLTARYYQHEQHWKRARVRKQRPTKKAKKMERARRAESTIRPHSNGSGHYHHR